MKKIILIITAAPSLRNYLKLKFFFEEQGCLLVYLHLLSHRVHLLSAFSVKRCQRKFKGKWVLFLTPKSLA